MFPNPITAMIDTPHSDTVLHRLLGGMSLFTKLMTIPQVLTYGSVIRPQGFALIVECLPCFCRSVVWFGIEKHDKNIYLPCVGWMVLDSPVIIGVFIYGQVT